MAKPDTSENPSVVGYDESQFEWETVHEEAPDQIIFEEIGDTYIGMFLGAEEITFTDKNGENQTFTRLRFRDNDGLKVINAGYELREAYAKIPPPVVTRTELKKKVDVGQEKPMLSYRIDQAKPKA